MYLGGIAIAAAEATEGTGIRKGCRCPVCGEAVFFRSGFIKGNGVVCPPCWCHYPDSKAVGCDNRTYVNTAKKQIETTKKTGVDQRLTIYNKMLWDMFTHHGNTERESALVIRKKFGDRRLKKLGIAVRKRLAECIKDANSLAAKTIEEISWKQENLEDGLQENLEDKFQENLAEKFVSTENGRRLIKYFQDDCDIALHLKVTLEILEFLSTNSSRNFWLKFTPYCLILMALVKDKDFPVLKVKSAKVFDKTFTDPIIHTTVGAIVGTDWLNLIDKRLSSQN